MSTGIAWLDQLRPASFRGMPFQVDSVEISAGNNLVVREYPFQDLPTVFAMGKAAEEIKLSGYVIGPDYTTQRDELREQLEVRGVGALVLPTMGTLMVSVAAKYTIKEAPTTEGGIARFDISFVRSQPRRYPVAVADTAQDAQAKADTAELAAADVFESCFNLGAAPGWVADQTLSQMLDSIDAIWGQLGGVVQTIEGFNSTVIGAYQQLRNGLNDLIRTPRRLAAALRQLFDLPEDLSAAAARDYRRALRQLFDARALVRRPGFTVSIVPPVGGGLVMYGQGDASVLALATPARMRLATLTVAMDQLTESLAVAAWVRVIARAPLASLEDSSAWRAEGMAQITRLLRRASTQELGGGLAAQTVAQLRLLGAQRYSADAADEGNAGASRQRAYHDAMQGLLAGFLADVQVRSRQALRTTRYTPQGWEPVWLVSYKLYGTSQYADEILRLNAQITHPLLCPPGQAIVVIQR
jgi:prophage DNA circulation protein